jgi:hypothetical protein
MGFPAALILRRRRGASLSAELWILFTGFWGDDKYWLDSAEWNDGA